MASSIMYSASNLPVPPDKERSRRMVEYSVSMGIRLICIGMCFVVPGWLVTLPILGAILLPWFAVVSANSKKQHQGEIESPHKPIVPLNQNHH